jgi:protein gp37
VKNTRIGWCDHTANLWWGCQEAGAECLYCYARTLAELRGKGRAWQDLRYECPGVWKRLDEMQSEAHAAGVLRTVFVQSMGDIFERNQQLVSWQGRFTGKGTGDVRADFLRAIDRVRWPSLVFLLLTKRPGLITSLVPSPWLQDWPANVWTGTSVGCRASLPQIGRLAIVPGRHFISFEPLLEEIDAREWLARGSRLDHCEEGEDGCVGCPGGGPECPGVWERPIGWGIVGGESGVGRREMPMPACLSLVDQLRSLGIPTYVKQDSAAREGQQGRIPDRIWSFKQFPEWRSHQSATVAA